MAGLKSKTVLIQCSFIDAREKNDVLMLVDALIATAEVQLTV